MMNLAHGKTGCITSISNHHDGKHVRVTVAHGRKKKPKPAKGATTESPMYGDYDNRPTTDILLKKEDAAHYTHGQRVQVGLNALGAADPDDDDGSDGEGLDDKDTSGGEGKAGATSFAAMKKSATSGLHRSRRA